MIGVQEKFNWQYLFLRAFLALFHSFKVMLSCLTWHFFARCTKFSNSPRNGLAGGIEVNHLKITWCSLQKCYARFTCLHLLLNVLDFKMCNKVVQKGVCKGPIYITYLKRDECISCSCRTKLWGFFQCVQGHFRAMQDRPLSVEFGANIKNVFF